MRQNTCYMLTEIAGVPYLLPVGQMIADQRRGIRINETGAYLWTLLAQDRTVEELTRLCAAHYHAAEESLPQLRADIEEFVSDLTDRGILLSSRPRQISEETPCKYVRIAGLICALYGPPAAFSKEWDTFVCEPAQTPDQTIRVLLRTPKFHENGMTLIRSEEFIVMEKPDKYILLFPSSTRIAEAHLTKDGSECTFYCTPPAAHPLAEELFHAIRPAFLYLAGIHHMAALHSASILYREKAWLFSASSGTGKSTHVNLWHSLLGTPILNGDLNLLALQDGRAVIHGIPWCGSSGISDTRTCSLGGILLLRQAPDDRVETLSEDRRRLLVLQRLISPSWDAGLYERNLRLVDTLAADILICRLHCTPQPSAMEAAREAIDSY